MTDLTEFLLTRIAEDEAVAKQVPTHEYDSALGVLDEYQVIAYGAERVLAECTAKRAIIESAWSDHVDIAERFGAGGTRAQLTEWGDYPDVLRHLAVPYADHDGYRLEWALR